MSIITEIFVLIDLTSPFDFIPVDMLGDQSNQLGGTNVMMISRGAVIRIFKEAGAEGNARTDSHNHNIREKTFYSCYFSQKQHGS
ncbi:MAG: hypothetical protein C4548_00075 [Desulfobacteraceae bacterium]|nr:MAG: hypothetical protein C4548_00075 [Desulfobacteraceae bacterium]